MKFKKKIIKQKKLYLFLILLFAFIIRFFNLWHPQAYIFDEVYCAFTAQEIAKGNIKAWEWWNPSPEGFAYGWTHPYLAKLIMAVGVLIFGQSQFAFRLPAAIFGTGVIYFIYLLAKQIFKNEKIALLSAFIASFDGLMFVMSRTGMLDIFLLFFLLGTIYFCLKEKYLWSGIFLGCSIATKWTGVYLVPVIGAILLYRICKDPVFTSQGGLLKHVKAGPLYLLLPIVIYLFSYAPFFTSGHSWTKFIELQKQMWGYHTGLKATHNRQSKAYTWPLMLRPVWFWVKYDKNKIANIYNLGNPVIWWGGLLILPYAAWEVIRQFRRSTVRGVTACHLGGGTRLGFVIFCYFSFWLPWIFSPRIMFLHHYMPAIPFLCIIIGWFLNRIQNSEFRIQNWKIKEKLLVTSYLLLATIVFFFFYPIYTGLLIPKDLIKYFFWLSSWK